MSEPKRFLRFKGATASTIEKFLSLNGWWEDVFGVGRQYLQRTFTEYDILGIIESQLQGEYKHEFWQNGEYHKRKVRLLLEPYLQQFFKDHQERYQVLDSK